MIPSLAGRYDNSIGRTARQATYKAGGIDYLRSIPVLEFFNNLESTAAKFYGASGRIIMKELVTLAGGQINARKLSYGPILNGSRQMLWYPGIRM